MSAQRHVVLWFPSIRHARGDDVRDSNLQHVCVWLVSGSAAKYTRDWQKVCQKVTIWMMKCSVVDSRVKPAHALYSWRVSARCHRLNVLVWANSATTERLVAIWMFVSAPLRQKGHHAKRRRLSATRGCRVTHCVSECRTASGQTTHVDIWRLVALEKWPDDPSSLFDSSLL